MWRLEKGGGGGGVIVRLVCVEGMRLEKGGRGRGGWCVEGMRLERGGGGFSTFGVWEGIRLKRYVCLVYKRERQGDVL